MGRHDTGGTGDCTDGHKRREVWDIWRIKPTQFKLGENATGDRIHQETTVFLEEFGTRIRRRFHNKERLVLPK